MTEETKSAFEQWQEENGELVVAVPSRSSVLRIQPDDGGEARKYMLLAPSLTDLESARDQFDLHRRGDSGALKEAMRLFLGADAERFVDDEEPLTVVRVLNGLIARSMDQREEMKSIA